MWMRAFTRLFRNKIVYMASELCETWKCSEAPVTTLTLSIKMFIASSAATHRLNIHQPRHGRGHCNQFKFIYKKSGHKWFCTEACIKRCCWLPFSISFIFFSPSFLLIFNTYEAHLIDSQMNGLFRQMPIGIFMKCNHVIQTRKFFSKMT